MSLITLTTEWQGYDYYNGVLKGKLLAACKKAVVVDNANGIPPFNLQHTAFVIRNTYHHYPKGSIHIICVQSEYHKSQPHMLVKADGHYFIGADNGVFHLILNSEPESVIKLNMPSENSFDETDIFVRAAASVINGDNLSEIGETVGKINEKVPLRATLEDDSITGSIIFIDSYGNLISNITKDLFNRVFSKKKYTIAIRSNKNLIEKISESYKSEGISDLMATFNSLNLLEIGINGADAAQLLSLQVGDAVRVAVPGSKKKPGTLF